MRIPGIYKIYTLVPPDHLAIEAMAGRVFPSIEVTGEVVFHGDVTLERTRTNTSHLPEGVLTFFTEEPVSPLPLAFVAELPDGRKLIVGTKEEPVSIEQTERIAPPDDVCQWQVTVRGLLFDNGSTGSAVISGSGSVDTDTGTASFTEATEQDIDDMITAITEPTNEENNESATE